MSRIGRSPVFFEAAAKVSVDAMNVLHIKGAKDSISIPMLKNVAASVDGNKIVFTRKNEDKESKSLHGLYRALAQNAVIGVTKGFTKTLEMHGVGYRANVNGKKLELSLGFSHPIVFDIPQGIEIKVDKQTVLNIVGANKELVGQVAAKIRSFRPPEPYLGKGVRYQNEKLRKKAGKSAGK